MRIIIPIHNGDEDQEVMTGLHWSLLVIDFDKMCVSHFDSLPVGNRDIARTFHANLGAIVNEMEFNDVRCYKQVDGSSCGVHVLVNATCYLEGTEPTVQFDESKVRREIFKFFETSKHYLNYVNILLILNDNFIKSFRLSNMNYVGSLWFNPCLHSFLMTTVTFK